MLVKYTLIGGPLHGRVVEYADDFDSLYYECGGSSESEPSKRFATSIDRIEYRVITAQGMDCERRVAVYEPELDRFMDAISMVGRKSGLDEFIDSFPRNVVMATFGPLEEKGGSL